MDRKSRPEFGPYYVPDKWCLDRYMHTDEVQSSLSLPDQFYVRDTTLREGEETPGLSMTLQDKVKIAEKLFEAGIRQIDVGYVGPAQSHYEAAKLIKREIPELAITGFARVWASDWKRDVDRCLEVGTAQIDVLQHPILIWATDELVKELGPPREALIPRTTEVIEYIKSCGARAAYGHPDCSRTPWEVLEEFYLAASQAGTDMLILYEDGYGCPPGVQHLVQKIRALLDVPLMIHCHDDLGLGTANTLAAVGAGVVAADLVVNGLGDKGGLTKLEDLRKFSFKTFAGETVPKIAEYLWTIMEKTGEPEIEKAKKMLESIKLVAYAEAEGKARLGIDTPKGVLEFDVVEVEGKWIPQEVVEEWSDEVAHAMKGVDKMKEEFVKHGKQIDQQILGLEMLVDQIEKTGDLTNVKAMLGLQ